MASGVVTLEKGRLSLSKTQLSRLFGRSPSGITFWTLHKGLSQQPDGRYDLATSLLWLEEYHKSQRPKLRTGRLTAEQVAAVFAVSRQAISNWRRAGLSRNDDETYDLKQICRWLRRHFEDSAEQKYQKQLAAIRRKLHRNVAQLERFLSESKGDRKRSYFLLDHPI